MNNVANTGLNQTILNTLRHKSHLHEQDRGAMSWRKQDMHLAEEPTNSQQKGKTRGKGSRASKQDHHEKQSDDSSEAENLIIGEALKAEKRAHGFGQEDVLDPALLELAQQQMQAVTDKDTGKVVAFELQHNLPIFVDLLTSKYNECRKINAVTSKSRLLTKNPTICAYECLLSMLISYILFILSHIPSGLSTRHPVFARIIETKERLDTMQPEVYELLRKPQTRRKIQPTRNDSSSTNGDTETNNVSHEIIDAHEGDSTPTDTATSTDEDLVIFGSDDSCDSSACDLEDIASNSNMNAMKANIHGLSVLESLEADLSVQHQPISGDRSVSAYEQRVQRSAERREAQRLQAIQAAETRKLKERKEEPVKDTQAQQLADTILTKQAATKDVRKAMEQNQKSYKPTYYDPTQDKIKPSDRIGYRPVSINMKKGQGDLKRHKSKHASTSRTLLRHKYNKAVEINQRTAVPTREQNGAYTGEAKGIRTNVTHSRKLG